MVQTDTNATSSLSVSSLGNGTFLVQLAGIPGYTYTVQATASLASPSWQAVGTATADNSGIVNFLDSPPGGIQRFYRLVPNAP
jgi:hypothetical protein